MKPARIFEMQTLDDEIDDLFDYHCKLFEQADSARSALILCKGVAELRGSENRTRLESRCRDPVASYDIVADCGIIRSLRLALGHRLRYAPAWNDGALPCRVASSSRASRLRAQPSRAARHPSPSQGR